MTIQERLRQCTGFDWDESNLEKNLEKHSVAFWEAEVVFLNQPLVVSVDPGHSLEEERYYGLGKTDSARLLFIVFTLRGRLIRVISARDMSRKERRIYERERQEKNSAL